MIVRPPADAVVALRSLDRRFRGLFDLLGPETAPDDVAHRNGPDGHSAADHIVAATRTLTFLGRALEQTLLEHDPVLHPAVADPTRREWPDASGEVEDRLSELAWEANALADRLDGVAAADWARKARVAGFDATVSASGILWDAVDSAVAHLRAAERALVV